MNQRRRLLAAFTRLAIGMNELSDRFGSVRVAQSVSRLARSLEELAETVEHLNQRLAGPREPVRLRLCRK